MLTLKNYISGNFLEPQNNEYLDSYNPSDGSILYKLPQSNKKDVDDAVTAAKVSFLDWSKLPGIDRAQFLYLISDKIQENFSEFAEAESMDQGKPLWLTKKVDIPRAIKNFRFFAEQLSGQSTESFNDEPGFVNIVKRDPVGVCALITPWNLPLYLLTWKIAPALSLGNTVVCKTSEITSLTAYKLSEIMNKIKLPNGVCNFVYGSGDRSGSYLTEHSDVAAISFTGGTKTGEKIYTSATKGFKKVGLELGGKNSNIVFSSCDLEKTVKTSIHAAFINQGEVCLSGSKILVEESIYSLFVEKFIEKAKSLKVGNPSDKDTFIGAIASIGHLNKILSYIEIAKEEKATILLGGNRTSIPGYEEGYYILPTVITDLKPDSRILTEEIFGPVVSISPVKSEEEAIEIANNTPYGLSATVFSSNVNQIHRVTSKLEVGQIWVNCWLQRDLRTPFGGKKSSGIGREGGVYSRELFTELKNICIHYS